MQDQEETWELVVDKAKTWLESEVEDEVKREEVWRVATELVEEEVGFEEFVAVAAKKTRKKAKFGLFD